MLLPFWDGLVETWRCDPEMRRLADRHYSRQSNGAREFLRPARTLVLRDCSGLVLFAWQWPLDGMRMDKQRGYNCAIFRNESRRRSSDIILEAETAAFARWGKNRVFTYIDSKQIRSTNPGWCFQMAGWEKEGISEGGLTLLAKSPSR